MAWAGPFQHSSVTALSGLRSFFGLSCPTFHTLINVSSVAGGYHFARSPISTDGPYHSSPSNSGFKLDVEIPGSPLVNHPWYLTDPGPVDPVS